MCVESFLPHQQTPAGDRRAFAALFDEHARTVFAHAVRASGDRDLADDMVSLTFLEAWRLRDKLRGEVVSPRAWLLGIATNVMRNTARTARRHRAAMSRLPPREPIPDFADEVVGRITDADTAAAAVQALGQLRRGEREVFMLVVWSGLGYAEAAQALGIPVGTVRSRLSRARDRIRKIVSAERSPGRKRSEPQSVRGHHPHVSHLSAESHQGRQP
ncbi:RNA polymerase sigma factor [Kitasatospora sp. NPDC059571]|uniref:RNA polymerase sigma factor n=1 Tax=Kitasatospora sp. NPDC059571 TaxID=3346871 RepID=UPI0036AB2E6B